MKLTLLFLAGALLGLCGCVSQRAQHGIPNLAVVVPHVLRGGQPQSVEDWQSLYDQGVREVVKLNTEAEGSDAEAVRLGMHVHYFPITVFAQLFGPSTNLIEAAVQAAIPQRVGFRFRHYAGVFIHCSHGEDRTGLVVAIYLHEVDGISKAQARADMLARGFHRTLTGLDWYWRQHVR